MKKVIAVIVGILVLGGIIYVIRLSNRTVSIGPGSNWITYRNEQLGFEFSYPPEWQGTKGVSDAQVGYFDFYLSIREPNGEFHDKSIVFARVKNELGSFLEYKKSIQDGQQEISETTINGDPAIIWLFGDPKSRHILIPKGEFVYSFSQNFSEEQEIVDEIAKTFRVL